jgi:hypothetical protein
MTTIFKALFARRDSSEKEQRGYERVRGLAAKPESLPTVRQRGSHVIVEMGGGELRRDFIPSNESAQRAG